MANRPYLLNTLTLANDPYALRTNEVAPGNDYLEADGPSYRIPVPWLCCFRPDDLKPVVIETEEDENNPSGSSVQYMPSTTVARAIHHLEQSLPLFEMIAGDSTIAHAYWSRALAFLRSLPLPFLALDPGEILDMTDREEGLATLTRALAGSSDAIAALKEFSGYEEGALPYPIDIFENVAGGDQRRTDNAIALDVAGYARWQRHGADPFGSDDDPVVAPPTAGQHDLGTLRDRIIALLTAREPDASAFYRSMPAASTLMGKMRSLLQGAQPVGLKMLLYTATTAQRDRLLADRDLLTLINGDIADQLRTTCTGYGMAWAGFVMESMENLERRFEDTEDWVLLPVLAPAVG